MNLLSIASRICEYKYATRADTLLEVDRAFEAKDIYPPRMKQTSKNVYRGTIGEGIDLEVTDVDVDASMRPKLIQHNGVVWEFEGENVKAHEALAEAVDAYIRMKGVKELSFTPYNGNDLTEGGWFDYRLETYSYDAKTNKEQLHIIYEPAIGIELDVTTTSMGPTFNKFICEKKNITTEANAGDWQAAADKMGADSFDPSRIFQGVGVAVEHAAAAALGDFIHENNIPKDGFFDWIKDHGYSIVDGVVKSKI